jgi:hypothetical protein
MSGFARSIDGVEKVLGALPNFAKDFNRARLLLKGELQKLKIEVHQSVSLLNDLVAALTPPPPTSVGATE